MESEKNFFINQKPVFDLLPNTHQYFVFSKINSQPRLILAALEVFDKTIKPDLYHSRIWTTYRHRKRDIATLPSSNETSARTLRSWG